MCPPPASLALSSGTLLVHCEKNFAISLELFDFPQTTDGGDINLDGRPTDVFITPSHSTPNLPDH